MAATPVPTATGTGDAALDALLPRLTPFHRGLCTALLQRLSGSAATTAQSGGADGDAGLGPGSRQPFYTDDWSEDDADTRLPQRAEHMVVTGVAADALARTTDVAGAALPLRLVREWALQLLLASPCYLPGDAARPPPTTDDIDHRLLLAPESGITQPADVSDDDEDDDDGDGGAPPLLVCKNGVSLDPREPSPLSVPRSALLCGDLACAQLVPDGPDGFAIPQGAVLTVAGPGPVRADGDAAVLLEVAVRGGAAQYPGATRQV